MAVIAMDRFCGVDVLPAESETCALKLNGLPAVVEGVPEINPVVAFRIKPGGSDPLVQL